MTSPWIVLLAPDADAQIAAQNAEAASERRRYVLETIARIETARAKIVAEYPAGVELDAYMVPVDADLARLRAERDA